MRFQKAGGEVTNFDSAQRRRETMFLFRQDGWPLCPSCHQDELYSMIMMVWDGRDPRPTLEECMAGELRCYACQWSNKQPDAGLYVYGTAGSLVMVCPNCKREHFRQFYTPHEPQYCVWCGDVILEPLRAGRRDDGPNSLASGQSKPLSNAQLFFHRKPPTGLPPGDPVDLFSPFVMFDIRPSTLCVVERLAAHSWKRRKFNPPCLRAGGRRSRYQVVRDPDPNFLIIDGKIIIGHPVTIRRLQEAMMQGPLNYSVGYEPPTL